MGLTSLGSKKIQTQNMKYKVTNQPKLGFVFLWFINLIFSQYLQGQNINNKPDSNLKLTGSIILPGVKGRIDHLAFDTKRGYVYVAALGNNSVEVVDLKNKKVVRTIKGPGEPQGISYIKERDVIFVANGSDGECEVFDAVTYQKLSGVKLDGDADNVRYDPVNSKIYVGYGRGGIAIIDAGNFKMLGDIKLPGHPESFQIDNESNRIYVNIPDALTVITIDTRKRSIVNKWKLGEAKANFPMSLDPENHLLFIGCRNQPKLLVISTDTGETIASVNIDADTDDVFYDNSSNQIFVSCGAGYVDVIRQSEPGKYEQVSGIESLPGARTSLFIPETGQLVVAAPARSGHEAQLLIYRVK